MAMTPALPAPGVVAKFHPPADAPKSSHSARRALARPKGTYRVHTLHSGKYFERQVRADRSPRAGIYAMRGR